MKVNNNDWVNQLFHLESLEANLILFDAGCTGVLPEV